MQTIDTEKFAEHCRELRDYFAQRSHEQKRLAAFYDGKMEAYFEVLNYITLRVNND